MVPKDECRKDNDTGSDRPYNEKDYIKIVPLFDVVSVAGAIN